MADIDRFRYADRRAVESLFRRVFGHDAAEANRLRWEWQYVRNPMNRGRSPEIWVAREGPTVIGQFGTMPVRLQVAGGEIAASWGTDLLVAPERQRQGLGEVLVRAWDHEAGATLAVGQSPSSARLFARLRWPDVGPLPCLVKPLTRRAFRQPSWPVPINRFVSALTLPVVLTVSRRRPLLAQVAPLRHFDASFTSLWERLRARFDFAVRRDADYLNWKYVEPPHIRYSIVALRRDDRTDGYAVYRHVRESRGRATLLVDLLADPDDEAGVLTLLRWIDREARAADSDKVRTFAMHQGYRRHLRSSGYFNAASDVGFSAKINAVGVPPAFYERRARWHVTLGDSDQDR